MDYIESTQVLESTQNLCPNTNKSNQIVGHLVIKGINHSLFYGENTIGRDPSCSIVITDKPVSAKHAILEVENEALHCIYDLGSSNKTKLRKAVIKPNVRYVLNDGDELVFANVPAIYKHVKVIPEELENDADRTEILTVPETPEKEDKTVSEIPISRVCDSDDSNADLFDDSQSRRISFQIPTFEVKEVEVKEDNIYGICTQSKDSSIYELDTQSFVENCEKHVSIYDFETEALGEKLKENIKTPIKEAEKLKENIKTPIKEAGKLKENIKTLKEFKRAPIITPSGSFEDLFCDSEESPEVKFICSNSKDEFKFSEDIFQASQGVEENNQVFINKKNESLCVESTSGLLKAGKFVLETSIFSEVNVTNDNANVLEKICISPINPVSGVLENHNEGITVENCLKLDQKFSQNEQLEPNLGGAERKNHGIIEQGGKSMDENQHNLLTENNCELENFIEENKGQVTEEKQYECSNQQESLTCENKINFVEQKNFWDIKNELLTNHKQLNDIEKSHNEIPAILGDHSKKTDESQQNVENCDEHIKNIFEVEHVDTLNCEDKNNFAGPKNLWDMETEELTTEDLNQLKNNLEQNEISKILEDVPSKKVITEEIKGIDFSQKTSPDKLSKKGESSNQQNEKVDNNCDEDTILGPKNIWDMETEELTTDELKNNIESRNYEEKINFAVPKNLWEIETEVITKNEDNLAPKNIWDIETQELTDHKQLKNIENNEILNVLNYEEKINFAVPKNLWEIETEVLTEDRNEVKNLEREIAKIPEDVALSEKNCQDDLQDKSLKLNEKHAKISYQLNAEDENKCEEHIPDISAVQHIDEGLNNEDKIKFVEPKNIWEIETEVLTTEHKNLNNIQKTAEVSEGAENHVAFSNVQVSEQIEESLTQQIQQLFNDSETLDRSLSTSNIVDNINFKIPLQGKETESNSVQKEDQIDSTLEDEDFEGFEPNECGFKKPEKLDVESEMAKLFGTNSDNQVRNFEKNGQEDCNYLKRILEDTQELKHNDKDCLDAHKIDTENLQAKDLINSESESTTFLKFDISKIAPEILTIDKNHESLTESEMCTQPIKQTCDVLCTQGISLDMEQNKGFKSPSNDSLNMSDMPTQAIVINQDTNSEQNTGFESPSNILNMSDMPTQAIVINQDTNSEQNTGFKSPSNDILNMSDMPTQAIVINQVTNTEQNKGFESPSNDSLNMSDMPTQAILINQDTNSEQNTGFKSPSSDILNMSDMPTQAIVINQVTNTEQNNGFESPCNDSLNMSDMPTQAIVINQVTNTEQNKGFESPCNDSLNMSDMPTQAIVINQDTNSEQNTGFKSPSNDSLNTSFADMPTQAVMINRDTNSEQNKGFESPSNDSLNMSDMPTQAVVINQDTNAKHKGFKSPSNDSLNTSFADMPTQAIIIDSTEIDVFETSTINTDENSDNLKDVPEMPTRAVQIIDADENLQEINEKPQNDLNDINLSDTQPIIVEKHFQDVIKNTLNQQNDNDIKDVILSELSTQPIKTDTSENINNSSISQETVVHPPKKIRKSRINMNTNKTETNVKNFKPKLALNINKHSSTLPNDINRTSFFIQQKTSQSLILESKKDVFDSSDDEDTHPNKRPRLFVISDDEDGDILPNKKCDAFEVDFKNETKSELVSKIRFKNKIYNSNESIYSAISMDETNVGVKDGSDMEETLINTNRNNKFTMSPFLSKIIECESEDSPKSVSPKVKEFGRGKRTRVAKMFKDYETDDTSEPQEILNKKIKLGYKKKVKSDEESNKEPHIQQPSGSNEQDNVKHKRSKVAKNAYNKLQNSENENVDVSTEDNHKNTRSRKTPLVRLGNNEKKIAKNIKPEENPERKDKNDRKTSERLDNRRKRTVKSSASETSSSSSSSTNLHENNQNIPNKTSKRTKNIRSENVKSEENPESRNESDKKAFERSDRRRKRTANSSASETTSSSSNLKENDEQTIPNITSKRTKNIRSEENPNLRNDIKHENDAKTPERSDGRRRKIIKSSASETSSSSSSTTNLHENIPNKASKIPMRSSGNLKPEENPNLINERKDENDRKTPESSNNRRKKAAKSSASETSSSSSSNSTKLQENNEQNIPNKRSKRTKNIKSSENIKPEENPDRTENDRKTSENSDSRRKRIAKSSASEISSSSSSSTKPQNNEQNITNKPSKTTKNTKKSSEENISVEPKDCAENYRTTYEKKTKRTVKSSEPEATSVPTSTKRATRSRAKNEPGKLRILFNGNYDQDMPLIIDRLNGEIVENPYTCTVVVAEKIEPTVNFLCGLSQGRPIVTPSWLRCSRDAGYFIDPYKHLLFDREGEEKFLFCLKNSINKATQVLLLKGWSIFATPSIEPSPTEFKSIVECSGGVFLKKIPSRWSQNSLVISCPDDEIKWSTMIEKQRKITPKIVSSEAFITSVLKQDLDFITATK